MTDARTATCQRFPHLPVEDAPNGRTDVHGHRSPDGRLYACGGRVTARMP